MKPNFFGFLKLAAKAGPVVYALARQFGPQLQRMVKENPEAFGALSEKFGRVVGTKNARSSSSLMHRTRVLREQVTYLYASANNSSVAKKAVTWRNELESLERAIPVLEAMGRRRRIVEKRQVEKRLDTLSSEILAASLVDSVEDAEVVFPSEQKEQNHS